MPTVPKEISEPIILAGSAGIIVSKAVENLNSAPTKQVQSVTDGANRQQMIAINAFYRSKRRVSNSADEVQDWLEAEAEIDGVSQPGDFDY